MGFAEFIEQIKWVPSINVKFIDLIQIVILSFAVYYLTKSVYKTRAWILVKGLLIIGAIYILICALNMKALQLIIQGLFSSLMIAIVIMLQSELQRIVELIGRRKITDVSNAIFKKAEIATWYSEKTIYEIAAACETMSEAKTGALIVLERGIPLTESIDSGIDMYSSISNQLLINIFEKNTPLHDGAVIIRNNKIASATCYLPLSTNSAINKNLGTRHRAAIGISESSDCAVVIVSEETGAVSFCINGELQHNVNRSQLSQLLHDTMSKSEEKTAGPKKSRSPVWMKVFAPIISIVVWASVISSNDPIVIKTIENVQVKTINTQLLDNAGHAYTIQSGDAVTVKAQGRRSIVDNLTSNDIVATADFSEMSIVYSVPINVETSENYDDVELFIDDSQVMKLSIEDMVQVELPTEVKIKGNIKKDRVVVPQESEVNTLMVTCPQSIAKTLDKAVLVVDATGKDNDFVSTVEPTVYDKNGNVISSNKLTIGQETIRISVSVYEVKEIPMNITLAEQDKSGYVYYVMNSCTAEFTAIKIAAASEQLDELKEINIVISPDVNSENISSMLVNVKQYIPENVYLANDQQEQLSIELDLTKYQKKVIELPMDQIKVTGYDTDEFSAKVVGAPATITMYYNTSIVDPQTLTIETLKPTIKAQFAASGTYSGLITITDIDGIEIVSELSAQYTLTQKW